MSATYNEILEKMKTVFYEKCNRNVDDLSDLGARFQALASELYALNVYGDYVLKQAFVQTASGKYLDYHAAMREIERKKESLAHGELTFSLSEPSESDTEIPEGSCVCVASRPYIQFVTVENGVIPAGELSVTVKAQALEAGDEFNISKNEATAMVNPPVSVSGVTNENPFIGGAHNETDESLRKRILNSYKIRENGINASSIAESILTIEDVFDCSIPSAVEANVLYVFVRTLSGSLSDETKAQIKEMLGITQLAGAYISIAQALPQGVVVKAEAIVPRSISAQSVKEEITQKIKDAFSACKIGEPLSLSKLSNSIDCSDFNEFYISSTSADASVITPMHGRYLVLENAEVSVNVE